MSSRLIHFGSITLIVWSVAGCFDRDEPRGDSESHFLSMCDSKCTDGLECICGVCTRFCDSDEQCSAIQQEAMCVGYADHPSTLKCAQIEKRAVCDMECVSDTDCTAIDHKSECRDGFCRAAESATDDASTDAIVESKDSGIPDASLKDTSTSTAVDATAPDQPISQPAPFNQLHGKRYLFVVDRQWTGRMDDLSDLPWTDGWTERPEEEFEAFSGVSYTVAFSADGGDIMIEGDGSDFFESGLRSDENDERLIYELYTAFAGGRMRIWSNGNALSAELMLYGSGLPVILFQRGTLVYKAIEINQLYGNRYSFLATGQWNSATFEKEPALDGCKELPDDDVEAARVDTNYAISFSDDGSEVNIYDADSSVWSIDSSGMTLDQSDTGQSIYEVFDASISPVSSMVGDYRLRFWTDGEQFGAEFLLSNGAQIISCEKGVLVDSCASDQDCAFGRVCEPGTGCNTDLKACVKGCRDDSNCVLGEACTEQFDCSDCPCPGKCESAQTVCVSPLQNVDRAFEPGSVGCACDVENQTICVYESEIGYVGFGCSNGYWEAMYDGPCGERSECGDETRETTCLEECGVASIVSTASSCLDNYQECWILKDIKYWGQTDMFCGESPRDSIPECRTNYVRYPICTSCGPIAQCEYPELHCLKKCRDDTDCVDEPIFGSSIMPSTCFDGMCYYGIRGCD